MQNGEKIPKKIILISPTLKNRNILTFDNEYKAYLDENKQPLPLHLSDNLQNLNDEIEIIEEDTIDIDSIEEINIKTKFTDYSTKITYLKIKYNELIKTVKQLNRELKELKER